jgi:hypothetical protein
MIETASRKNLLGGVGSRSRGRVQKKVRLAAQRPALRRVHPLVVRIQRCDSTSRTERAAASKRWRDCEGLVGTR